MCWPRLFRNWNVTIEHNERLKLIVELKYIFVYCFISFLLKIEHTTQMPKICAINGQITLRD